MGAENVAPLLYSLLRFLKPAQARPVLPNTRCNHGDALRRVTAETRAEPDIAATASHLRGAHRGPVPVCSLRWNSGSSDPRAARATGADFSVAYALARFWRLAAGSPACSCYRRCRTTPTKWRGTGAPRRAYLVPTECLSLYPPGCEVRSQPRPRTGDMHQTALGVECRARASFARARARQGDALCRARPRRCNALVRQRVLRRRL